MNIKFNPGRRFTGALLPVIALASSHAWAGPVYTVRDAGAPRNFEIASDEVAISGRSRSIGRSVKTALADAVVVKDTGNRVVVRFPKADWRTVVGPRTFGDSKFEPVMYEQGAPRSDASRRILTSDVLASGAAADELVRVSGAPKSKASGVDGFFMLSFASPEDALRGTEKLRKAGLKGEPQLRRLVNKRAELPNDISFPDQWHLQNLGQGNGAIGTDVNPLLAWNYNDVGVATGYTGSGVVIAIVDDGLELAHPDLFANALPLGAGGPHHDFNGDSDDPSPGPGDAHGTACGGVAAARGNNGLGVTGSAPLATLLGLRLISGEFTDADEQAAFTWSGGTVPTVVDISSNSWGPFDDVRLEGPDILALDGLRTAVTTGRNGKGTVFCWAAGNGGGRNDNVNLDGYANSRYTIAVGAIANTGRQSSYSESGSSLLVSAPSNGGALGIFTTDVTGLGGYNAGPFFTPGEPGDEDYTNSFGGTSSAAPLVSGIAALVLEANPELGYRDVMEILASTAAKVDSTSSGWKTNGAGFFFHHGYGGGMADATAAVIRAETWVNLGPEEFVERTLLAPALPASIPDASPAGVNRSFDFTGTAFRVEQVELQVDIAHSHRSDLEITLRSPSGHVSRIIEKRNRPTNGNSDANYTDGNLGWIFTSTQHWGEDAAGTWTVNINDTTSGTSGTLRKASLRLYGNPQASKTRFAFVAKTSFASEAGGQAVIEVQRLGNTVGEASVDYFSSDRTDATDGEDFTAVTGTLVFADGETVKTITVPLLDDTDEEGDEHVYVVLHNPSIGTLGGATVHKLEIDDDEGNAITVAATDAVAAEVNLVNAAANPGTFTISRRFAGPALAIKYSFTPPVPAGTPTATNYAAHIQDFSELPLIATIPANETSVTVTISPRDDRASEGTELAELFIVPDQTYNIGFPNKASVAIVDNDLVPIQVTSSVTSVVESSGTEVVFTISRETSQLDAPLTVLLEESGTAQAGMHFRPSVAGNLTIPAGRASATVSITPIDNPTYNPTRTLILGVSQGTEYKEGFFYTTEVRIIDDEPLPDTVKPKVTVVAPTRDLRIDSPEEITASGVATDNPDSANNTSPALVRYRLNGGDWDTATLTANDWSANITSKAVLGDNLLEVQARDEDRNDSSIASVTFTYVKSRNLTTTVVGPGSITADFTGTQALEVGQPYTIVARPSSASNLFSGWTGAYTATTKTLSFTMPDEDISLTATFASSLINEAIIGRFAGLITRSFLDRGSLFELATSGHLDATVSKTGKLSGKLIYGGVKYSVRGEMTGDGRFIGSVPRRNNTPLGLTLELTSTLSNSRLLSGTISADGTISQIVCPKVLTKAEAATVTTGIAGKFTFELPTQDRLDQTKPQGTGVATLTIDAKGIVRWKGTLPDGTPAVQSAFLSKDKTWPLFLRLFDGRGVMLGTIIHDSTPTDTDLTGSLNWHKTGFARDKILPGGFTIEGTELRGSKFVAPESGQRVLTAYATANGTLQLDAGNITSPFASKTISISDKNKVSLAPAGEDGLELKISTSTGAITGAFNHPVTKKRTKISGVVLQKTQRGSGIFTGSTNTNTAIQTGRMSFSIPPQ